MGTGCRSPLCKAMLYWQKGGGGGESDGSYLVGIMLLFLTEKCGQFKFQNPTLRIKERCESDCVCVCAQTL